MKTYNRFWLFAFAATTAVAVILAGLACLIWHNNLNSFDNEAVLLDFFRNNAVYLLIGLLVVLGAVGTGLRLVFNRYVLPTTKLADELMLIHSANPSHRIDIGGGKEIQRLAALINEGADRNYTLKKSVDEKIRLAGEALELEKNILASIISCLSEGIVVCNPSGEILLFNKQVEEFLGTRESSADDSRMQPALGHIIGIGRDISRVLNKTQIQTAMSEIREKIKQSFQSPGTCFATIGPGGDFLKVEAVPILGHVNELTGYILRINPIRQTDIPQSGFSASEGGTSCGLPQAHLLLKPVQIQQVLESFRIAAREKHEDFLFLGMPDDPEWIYADIRYLAASMLFLSDRLAERNGSSDFECLAGVEKDYIYIDMIWTGTAVPTGIVNEWNEQVITPENGGGFMTLGEILSRHEAEWWSSPLHHDSQKASFRIFFPSAEPYRVRAISPVTLTTSRPEFYDFDLLKRTDISPALREQLLSDLTYTVIDTETTGLDPFNDEIISIGAVRIVNGRLRKNEIFNTLVDPRRELSDESIKIHGIRPEMLQGQPTIDTVLPQLYQFAENTVLVGHNVAFDMRMLQLKELQSGVRFKQPVLDVMILSSVIHASHRNHSLEAVSERLGITIAGRHTALGDAFSAGEILLRCIPLLARMGILTLNDALQASESTGY